ncbi:MAG: hypothetical protein L3K00_05435 [Thermoplasmata archaeon]|nr:hypothetical protein [Thermoplasmata archaeon]
MAAPEPEEAPGPRLRPTKAEREAAVAHPGLPWREWFYFSFLKVWIGLGFLILDALIAAEFAELRNLLGLVLGLVVAVYLEFLAYRLLWTRPGPEEERSTPYQPTWYRPVRFGRWTPEAWHPEQYRRHLPSTTGGPDPHEFL